MYLLAESYFQAVLRKTPLKRTAIAQTSKRTVFYFVNVVPIIMERASCYLLLKELNLCLKDMQKVVDSGDKKMTFDYGCL